MPDAENTRWVRHSPGWRGSGQISEEAQGQEDLEAGALQLAPSGWVRASKQ